MPADEIRIAVNGTPQTVPIGTTVGGLIDRLALSPTQVAVERNREIVPRAQHGGTALAEGDVLEIVTFVGGG